MDCASCLAVLVSAVCAQVAEEERLYGSSSLFPYKDLGRSLQNGGVKINIREKKHILNRKYNRKQKESFSIRYRPKTAQISNPLVPAKRTLVVLCMLLKL
jgi:hypothetical protein